MAIKNNSGLFTMDNSQKDKPLTIRKMAENEKKCQERGYVDSVIGSGITPNSAFKVPMIRV